MPYREYDPKKPRQKKASGRAGRARFTVIAVADINFDPSDAGWLVEGLLPDRGLAVLYGRWKSFKSFIALDLAWGVGGGASWAGRPIKRRGAVVYIAAEGAGGAGIRKRIAAYKLNHDGGEWPPLYLIEARPNLGWAGTGDVAELVEAIGAALPADLDVALIIIDTLSRTLAGKDENGEGMRNFLDNAEDLGAKLNSLVLAVHHEGADDTTGRPRGGTVLPAGVVATWRVKRQRGELACKLIIEEAKDSVSDLAFDITLRKFEFGDEHDERREGTLMVDEIEASAVPGVGEKVKTRHGQGGRSLRAFMDAVRQALHDHGTPHRPFGNGRDQPTVRAVDVEQVRPVYYAMLAGQVADDSRREYFKRRYREAIDAQEIVARETAGLTMVWLPKLP